MQVHFWKICGVERAAQADPARPPVPQGPDLPTGRTTPDRTETAIDLDEGLGAIDGLLSSPHLVPTLEELRVPLPPAPATVVNMHLVYVQGLRRNVLPRSELSDDTVHLVPLHYGKTEERTYHVPRTDALDEPWRNKWLQKGISVRSPNHLIENREMNKMLPKN
ncbi:hypothetical protein PIB30_102005 [Stylosanthes scabra]|uniref:Uncharacterized protein n=1 Tax=Stylosanthes scabra TaxID=79078 RepID=A0ABU6VZJ5_9FABA|nr:hypothetical protein [Stylosanthes scabra]